MTDKEQHEEILKQLDALYEAYAKEFAKYAKTKDFDEYNPRCIKKTEEIAEKYAQYIRPLQAQANALADKINAQLEEERKNEYMTVAEYEEIKNKIEHKNNKKEG